MFLEYMSGRQRVVKDLTKSPFELMFYEDCQNLKLYRLKGTLIS